MAYDNILITPGGSGTNFIYAKFGKGNLVGDWGRFDQDKWPNPHQRFATLRRPTKVMYLMAHPLNILMSFERREFFESLAAVKNLQGDVNEAKQIIPCSLSAYAHHGVNLFDFSGHYRAWEDYCRESGNKMLFVKYEAIARIIPEIERFTGLGALKEPRFVPRQSDYEDLPETVYNKLCNIHRSDIDLYGELPDYLYIGGDGS